MTTDPNQDTGEFPAPPSSGEGPARPPGPSSVQVEFGALSHPGKVRPNNEDFYLVVRADRTLTTLLTNVPEGQIPSLCGEVGYGLLVADGMGGMAAGEVASRMAICTLVDLVLHTPDWIMRIDEPQSERVMRRITRRYREVDAVLSAEAQANAELAGMGTTMTLAFNLGHDLFLGHVGDSRAYFLRGADFHQLTRDHTLAQALADAGIIRQEEVVRHRLRHALTRALGGGEGQIDVDVQRAQLGDGDQILLCTDGLSDAVDDATIAAVLQGSETATVACNALVQLALNQGGKDNITVVLARYRFAPEP
jgi:protein phosphatase